jgi:drug/metabolite transporter (DMT)-like permease
MSTSTLQTRSLSAHRWLLSPQIGLSAATLFWSGNFIVGRALREDIDPIALNFWRWCIAGAVLAVFFLPTLLKQWPLLRRHLGLIAMLGLTGIAVPHSCIYAALQSTSAVNALLLLNLVPVLVTLGAKYFFQQPIHARQWCGIATCLFGAVSLLVRWDPAVLRNLHFTSGDLWMLPAIAGGAAHILLLKKTPAGISQGPLLLSSVVAALLMMAPALAWTGEVGVSMLTRHWASVIYIGVFASAVAFFLWNRGVANLGAHRAAPFMYLMPVYGAFLSIFFLDEPPQGYQLAGGAIVLAGLWLARPTSSPATRSGA